jgi:hypothetical protein
MHRLPVFVKNSVWFDALYETAGEGNKFCGKAEKILRPWDQFEAGCLDKAAALRLSLYLFRR